MKRLKALRQLNEMTRDELAAKLGLSFTTIANYEQGIREPKLETLKKLSEIFNVTVDYLIENDYVATSNNLLSKVDRIVAAEKVLENEKLRAK